MGRIGTSVGRRFLCGDTGSEIVEFALASMLFFGTIFGILEFGQGVWRYNMIANLAQEGARRASVCGSGRKMSSTECNISNYVISRAVLTICNTCVTTTPSDISTLGAGSTVTVRVTHTFTPLTTLIPNAAVNISATAKMIVAR
jgi:Flp pilus assembly protein TadG